MQTHIGSRDQLANDGNHFYGQQIFLEDLLGRHVELVTEKALREEFRHRVEADAIII
ncbi:hypothetical protein [Synechococcus sp. RedBA-s]|uniref:hypothetical protein n=1 Tax=Synechococcus sp. RedBA-s TaxID=2823741 RepID=UPI0020CDCA1D|nr:hypothetical protein [Synechococcus sp. RedBA-s]MCP9800277.1 hypothetical protein [Synechococcus sp. RedBA-s]